ncbi:hypothetical protein EH183_24175 [Streptomyces sp. CB01881]|nr:hypothetical protein C2142_24185 [Streptomyces sp. CB01881]TYC74915.1 hypothetical protein EH183_24175 [Streptomyces sp. CB01881]
MSTYLALTFGTLLSSQGTDTSFGPPSSGPSGRFVLSCSQLIRSSRPFLPAFVSLNSHWGDFLQLRSEAYQSFRCAQFRDLPRRRARICETRSPRFGGVVDTSA